MIEAHEFYWSGARGLQFSDDVSEDYKPDVVFYFMDKRIHKDVDVYSILKKQFSESILFGCSSSGPILYDDIYLGTFTGIAVTFEKTKMKTLEIPCPEQKCSYEAGKETVIKLKGRGLRHIFVIADGMTVNGAHFIKGANKVLPKGVSISGGLASDGFEFAETLTGINKKPVSGQVCAIGFYGKDIEIGYGAQGGWDKFGLERLVTKSEGNTLYELDGQPALDLYKEYLGDAAENLPSSGLLFPLEIRKDQDGEAMVRTINAVDEINKSLRFTGDIPQGYIAQFMKGNFKNLAAGGAGAATQAIEMMEGTASFGLMVSCLGRQLLMGNQVSRELEAVMHVLENMPTAGFYSNGEFSFDPGALGILHNETMTLTVFKEKS
ncbi:MAG: FIST C-terminal domain-containing protein [Alphaproteobacteria bacterium]|nr:FIST C-terminal domain-containing protein [Alphaproteobacteria bacterium]